MVDQGHTDRAPVGMLCRCPASMWLHRHLDNGWTTLFSSPAPIPDNPAWRALAREDHDAAKAKLLKELFP